MEIRYRKCDHCGKTLDEMKDYPECEIDKYGLIVADLCEDCHEELERIIYGFLNREKE